MSLRLLVTGGSRGLGRAIALGAVRAGARVAFTWRTRREDADETLRLLGEGARSFQGSVDDAAHAERVVESLCADWGGLDALVCAAGVVQILPIALLEEADWERTMSINVKGAYLFARAALKPMIKAKRGAILVIGSAGSDRVLEAPVHYAASKAALAGFAASLAREVARYRIRVNCLEPGLVESALSRRLPAHQVADYVRQTALGRLPTPDEIAAHALALLDDADGALVTGARVKVDGGF